MVASKPTSIFFNADVKRVYISGPMADIEQQNFPLFKATTEELRGDFYGCSHLGCSFIVSHKTLLEGKAIYDAEKRAYLLKQKGGTHHKPFKRFTLCPRHPKDRMGKTKHHFEVVNPAELPSELKRILEMEKMRVVSGGRFWRDLVRHGQTQVAGVDAILVLPNWQKSRGAKEEVRAAAGVSTPVYELSTMELLPIDQLPRLSPAGGILEEALWVTEGQRGDGFAHPFEDYNKVARQWEGRGLGKWTAEGVAYALMLRAEEKLVSRPNRASAIKVLGFLRCIEEIAEEIGGWECLKLSSKKAAPSSKRRSVMGTSYPIYALKPSDMPQDGHLSPTRNILSEAARDEKAYPLPSLGDHYQAIVRSWEAKGRGKWKWTSEAVIYELILRADESLALRPSRESMLKIIKLYRHLELIAEELGSWHRMRLLPVPRDVK